MFENEFDMEMICWFVFNIAKDMLVWDYQWRNSLKEFVGLWLLFVLEKIFEIMGSVGFFYISYKIKLEDLRELVSKSIIPICEMIDNVTSKNNKRQYGILMN